MLKWLLLHEIATNLFLNSSRALGDQDDRENISGIRGYENGRVYVAYQNEGVS